MHFGQQSPLTSTELTRRSARQHLLADSSTTLLRTDGSAILELSFAESALADAIRVSLHNK
eukprot:2132828-Amphidinium_carterae.1